MDEEEDERYSSCGDHGIEDDIIYGNDESSPRNQTANKYSKKT